VSATFTDFSRPSLGAKKPVSANEDLEFVPKRRRREHEVMALPFHRRFFLRVTELVLSVPVTSSKQKARIIGSRDPSVGALSCLTRATPSPTYVF
jgi:hypothetical protein